MNKEVKVNGRYADEIGSVKVMAVVDGYVMARRPKCMPFIRSVSDFLNRFSVVTKLEVLK